MDNKNYTTRKVISLDKETDTKAVDEALKQTEKNLRDMLKDGRGVAKDRLKKLLPLIVELQRRGFTYKQIHAKIGETVDVSQNALIEAVKEYKSGLGVRSDN